MASTLRTLGLLTLLAVAGFAGIQSLGAQQAPLLAPQVQNGQVEHRAVTDVARDLAALGATAPVWVGWTVPMADGPRDLCNWYSSPSLTVRGFFAESVEMDAARQIAPASSPVPLEAGNGLVVLARVENGTLQRVRTLSDDCPIDAGGRTVYWLDGVTPAASLAWLETLTAVPTGTIADRLVADERRSIASAAVGAIAMHASADADGMLERLVADPALRRTAASRMAAYRGATGFETLRRMVATETDDEARRALVSALGQTRQPGTPDALLRIAREDADARARGDAVLAYLRLTGPAGIPDAMALVGPDADDIVVSRVVSGLSAMPDDGGVASLVTIARSGAGASARRSAVSALGRSDAPAAADVLLQLARGDADTRLRSEAAYHYIRAAGLSGAEAIVGIIENDAEVSVKRRAIAGLVSLPDGAGLPALITLARSSADLDVKKEAVTALSRSDDPRARALLTEIIKR